MKKGLAKRILVSLLTVVMISASVLPMLVSTANVARANENVTNVLTEGVEIDTPNVVKDEMYSDYVKVTFIVNDTETIVKYVKTGDTVTVRSTNSSVGVLVGDAPNGSAVTEDTTIYVKTYNYKDVLNIKKELVNEYGEPDADGYYTLKFTAGAKNMPSIHSATRNDMVLVIDASLSMACSVKGSRATDGNEYMADTYADTRFKAMYNAVDSFLNAFLPEGNDKNTISLVIYNVSALDQLNAIYKKSSTTKKSEVMAALDAVFNEAAFNESFANSPKNEYGVNVDKMTNPGSLASKTNVKAGLDVAADIFVANNNTNAKSIILFTDGVANRPNTAVTTESMTQYAVGGTYTYNETDYTISDIAYKTSYYNENNEEIKDNKNQIAAAYYASQKGQELAKDNVSIYSFALIDSVTDNVRAAMGDTNLDVSEYVSSASPVKKTTNIKLQISPKFTYTESGTGYAKKFFATTNVDELNKEFKSIIASLKELPFDTATVTDTLDEHFELVPGQTGVTDNGNGTFTVTYPNKITTDAQEITVKIKAKDGYAGSSYTNAGCTFNATVGDLTYSQDFAEEPSAVITPDAVNDSYTVNQGETLTVADVSVLDNDNNIKVNNPDKNVTIKAEKVTDPQNGTITFNEDGTFTYTPNNGFSGEDTFRYKTVLTVDGRTYEKEATVTITVVPKYTQTIKYVLENGTKAAEDNVQTVVKGNSTTAVTSPSISGYKPSIEVVEATSLTGDKEIIVKYVRDDEQTKNVTYTVEYYKDNVKDDTKTQSYTNPIWVNDNEQNVKLSEINTTDKFGAGYKFEKTEPATIPSTIADNGVIKVYYVADTFDYSVKYVLEGTDTELVPGYTKLATFGTEVGADKKNIEGYTVVDADKKLTIGSDESQNVLVIEYRANTYGYSVEYYYDGVKDESATLNKLAQFNTIVNSYDPKEKPGYKFEKNENLPLTITTDASKNVIKVYYVKDASQTKNITYTVKYFKDGVEVTADEQKETKPIWVNDTKAPVEKSAINTTDKYEGFSFDADTTGVIPDTIGNDGVIRVYYVSNYYNYTVEYYYDDVIDNAKTDTFPAKYNTQVNRYDDKNIEGYKLERATTPITITTDASKNVIRVYYVKDWFKYTINYYYDGVIDTSATVVDKAAFGTTIKYSDKMDKLKEGFKFVSADGSPLVISVNEAANVINIHYVSGTYTYTVEYYYDGIIDTEKTEKNAEKYNSVVNAYTDKCDTGYKFEKVEGLPLTIATDESKNVIRVYYVKDESQKKNVTYTVKYFKDGTEVTEDQQTKTDTVWVNASSNMTVDKTAINTTDKYVGYKLDTSATGTIPDTVTDGDVINVYYVKDTSQTRGVSYTVEYYKDGVKDDSKTDVIPNDIWVNDDVQPVDATKINVTDKFGAGYKFEKTEPATIPSTIADKGVIKVYYVRDNDQKKTVSYTVEYYKDDVKDDSKTETFTNNIWVNDNVQSVQSENINTTDKFGSGYRFEKTDPATIPATIADKGVIKVYYVRDDGQKKTVSYTVEYYKDGVKDDSKTDTFTNNIWVNATEQQVKLSEINTTDKFGAGYKFEKTDPATIPATIADKGVIKVYYVAKEFKYTVKYVLEGTDTELTAGYTKSATFGTEVGADKKNIEGYTVVDADKKLTIGSDESQNVLVIEYRANTYGYSVEYYYDGVKDESATLNKSAQFNIKVDTYDPKEKPGYKFEKTESCPLTITTDASKNIIKVYYVKDENQKKDVTYTVKYFKDGVEVTADEQKVTKQIWVNDTKVTVEKSDINTTDKYEGFSFDADTTGVIPDTIGNDGVIRVYYVSNYYNYTVEYYYDDVIDNAKTDTFPAKYNTQVNRYDDKNIEGYKLERATTPITITTDASKNVIRVYYVKDWFKYTINYYYDGVIDTSATVVDKAAFGTTIKYSDKMDKLKEGFKFVSADGSPLVISVNEAANVINIHYVSGTYTYTVEYYYDGIIDTEKTEKNAEKYNSVVNAYTDKCDTGYKFEKVEGLPLTIATDESKNVIRVYYVKDESQKKNVTYTVKYFKDGTEVTEDQQTKTDTVWVNASSNMTVDKTAINTTDKYVGYKLDTSATGTIPDTVTDGDVINVYYVKDTSQTRGVSYTVEYYKDGVKDDSKTDVIPNDIWVNDDVQPVDATKINVTDKFGAGYKFEKTDPATIPSTIADKAVIKVYYVAKEFKYTVKYVLEGTDTELTAGYTKSATFGTEVGADKKNIEGYTVVDADKKLTIGSDESQNVLVIEYRANTYGYSVEYYYDGVKDESATLNKSAQFNTKVNSYDPGEKPGYKFEKTENLPLTITTDASKNVIKVYYVKDASQTKNITYTVKYFKDGAEVTADKQTVTKTVWVNDPSELTVDKTAINTTDKYVGYKLDSAATGEIPTVVADGTVINVYYVKDELQTKEVTYTVKYFRDGVEVTADKQTVTKRIWINAPLEVEVNKTAINTTDKYVGYKLDSAATGEIPSVVASGTVINVYYVKDASQTKDVTYTIKYYKDGEEQTEDTITVTKKVWVNEPSVIDVNKADINTTDKYEGYTFDSETTGIIPNKADNGAVIKVYYKKVVVPAEPSSDNSQETVKTGDNSNMMLYVLMLATCVAGAATVVVTGRKKSEQE